MLKLFKITMLIILMTAINGQALAIASMSCQMTDSHSHQASMMNMDEKDIHELDHSMHADHDMQNMSQEMDCCKTQCVCPTSGCSQSVYLSLSTLHTPNMAATSQSIPNEAHFSGLTIFTAFKPPIFA